MKPSIRTTYTFLWKRICYPTIHIFFTFMNINKVWWSLLSDFFFFGTDVMNEMDPYLVNNWSQKSSSYTFRDTHGKSFQTIQNYQLSIFPSQIFKFEIDYQLFLFWY